MTQSSIQKNPLSKRLKYVHLNKTNLYITLTNKNLLIIYILDNCNTTFYID